MCARVLRLGGVACVLAGLAVLAVLHAESTPHLVVYGALALLAVASIARRVYAPPSCARGVCFGALFTALAAAAVAHAALALEAPALRACQPPAELTAALAAAAAASAHWREARDWAALVALLALVAGTRAVLEARETRASAAAQTSAVDFIETERRRRAYARQYLAHRARPMRAEAASVSERSEDEAMESVDLT